MTLARSLFALTVVAGLTAWLVASGDSRPAAPAPPAPRLDTAPGPGGPALRAHADRLRARLAAMADRPPVARNPFRFETPAGARTGMRAAAVPQAAAAELPPPRPELHFVGLAEDVRDGALDRTAIVTGFNQLYLVREGEQIALRFLVKRIGADAIELEDLADGTPVRLGLR